MEQIKIDGRHLTLEQVIAVSRHKANVIIDPNTHADIHQSRDYVEQLVNDRKVVYGITTGFGKFSNIVISDDQIEQLQVNLIRSHACGVGNYLPEDVVLATMLLRINALVKGLSGIRLSVLQLMADCINHKIIPLIPEKGSLGSSGDLAPLSHMVLTLLGEGECMFEGKKMIASEALHLCGLSPITLKAKEGLALINGTQVLTAIGALACYDAIQLLKMADISSAMTFEALRGVFDVFDPKVHIARNHHGQMLAACNFLRILEGSRLMTKQGELKLQDSYSLRCLPQIHGASKDAVSYVLDKINKEMNAVTDNPLIFADDDQVISCGNFHGQPMALAFDFLGIAMAEIANSSERRIERLVNPSLSELPAFLTKYGGVNSGFMIMQYTAAALVSENKILAHPASVDSIPSSGNQEDHVSMGTIAARKAYEIVKNARHVIAIEWLCAAQGVDFGHPERLGKGTKIAYDILRSHISYLDTDRTMYPDIEKAVSLIIDGEVIRKVEDACGILD